jgi:predicted transcriptional regulator
MVNAKQQVESLLHKLPESCSLEDIQYHLYVLDKVRHGLEDARRQGTVEQEEAEKRLSKWLTE